MEESEPKLNPEEENKEKLRDVSLVFLVKKDQEEVTEICLAMKAEGFGSDRWNGVGGKFDPEKGDQTILDTAKRETGEEIGVEIKQANKVAELSFYFPHNPAWSQKVHVYFAENWNGEPTESNEMKQPQWFPTDREKIPFEEMWPDDIFWLPEVIDGKLVRAKFVFGENDVIQDKEVEVVEKL